MANLIDHPNRPSVLIGQYAGECYANACAAEANGNAYAASFFRLHGHKLRKLADDIEHVYETKVSELIAAALDVRDGGGWTSNTPAEAMAELIRCVNDLRTGRRAA